MNISHPMRLGTRLRARSVSLKKPRAGRIDFPIAPVSRLILISILGLYPFASYGMDVHDLLFQSLNVPSYSSVGLSINGSGGNRDSKTYELQLNSSHRGESITWLAGGEIADSQTGNVKTNEQKTAQVRLIQHLSDNGGIEAFLQYQRDVLEGLSKQMEAGIGYRYEYKADASGKLNYALGAGVTRQQIQFTTVLNEEQNTRANLYASMHIRFGSMGRSTLTLSAEATPEFSNWSDWRGKTAATLRVPVSEKLFLSVQAKYTYDAKPEFGIKSHNSQYSTALTFTF